MIIRTVLFGWILLSLNAPNYIWTIYLLGIAIGIFRIMEDEDRQIIH